MARYFGSEFASESSAVPDKRSSGAIEEADSGEEEDVDEGGSVVAPLTNDADCEVLGSGRDSIESEDARVEVDDQDLVVLPDGVTGTELEAAEAVPVSVGSDMDDCCRTASAGQS